ncbi:TolC family outer membrane protein [Gilvimarinus sp. F26214L]|uniref:TolC family outer membrane protein n=1 Tax=Gilvimarinus sp. DZF01 TaxID=3461371 RepID=UPI004045E49D
MKFLSPSASAVCLLLASGLTHSATLLEIYEQALDNDPELAAARSAYEAGLENRKIGLSALLPQISGSASYEETDGNNVTSGPQVFSGNIFPDATDDTSSEGDTTSWSVRLQQPLFDMGAWYSYKSGAVNTEAALVQFKADQQDFIVRVATAYFDVLRAIDTLETALAEQEALESQLEQTRQRYEVGLTAITDVHEVQAQYDSAVASAIAARGNLAIYYEALEVLTGQPHDQVAPIEEDFPVTDPVPAQREAWVEFALQNNYSLQSARLNADLAELTAKTRRADHLPTLNAVVGYSESESSSDRSTVSNFIDQNEDSPTFGLPISRRVDTYRDTENDGWSAGLNLSVPVFSGGRVSAQRRQAYAQAMRADDLARLTQRQTIQLARASHLAVETGVVRVEALRQAIVSNQSALEATQAGYEVGTRTLVDVLLAQRNLYSAQRNYYDALYNYILDTLSLKQAAGTLSPEDVVKLNEWLNAQSQVSPADFAQ